jgi:hypothetical protein
MQDFPLAVFIGVLFKMVVKRRQISVVNSSQNGMALFVNPDNVWGFAPRIGVSGGIP